MKLLNAVQYLLCLGLGVMAPLFAEELPAPSSMPMGHAHEHTQSCQTQELRCANAATPALLPNGSLLLTWTAGGAVNFAKSNDGGKTFEPTVTIAQHQASLDTGGDARPQIVADAQGHVMIAYGYFKDSHWNAKVNYAVSSDFGAHFSPSHELIDHGESERFPVLGLKHGGVVAVAWIDKRVVAQQKKAGKVVLGGSIAYTQTADWGKTFAKEVIVSPQSCECCRIGLGINLQGQSVLAYRAIFDGSVRDHAVQMINDQLKASPLDRVSNDHWKTDVCPHQGPSIAISDSGALHVTWFTQGDNRRGLYYAHTVNSGGSFSEPMKIGHEGGNPSRAYVASSRDTLWMVWKEFDGVSSTLWLMHSKDQGESWSPMEALMSTQGYSDHPLLVEGPDQIYVSWLTRQDGYQLRALGR